MRVTALLPLFLAPIIGARASSSLTGRDPTADVCASLNTEIVVPDVLGILTAVGVIDTCLCLSDLPAFLETNVVGILAVTIAGEPVVTDILTSLINNAASISNCVYPDHSTPACVNGNPCGFNCDAGFTPTPAVNSTECVCPSGQVAAAGATSCSTCPRNTIPNANQTDCEPCPVGSTSALCRPRHRHCRARYHPHSGTQYSSHSHDDDYSNDDYSN